MIKVIIVEDDELQRSSFVMAIEFRHPDLCVVGEAATGAALFSLLDKVTPDIILLDINLPDMSGLDIARRLKRNRPEIKILVISMENDAATLQALVDAGIEGFLNKRENVLNNFAEAVRSIMDGLEYFGTDIARIIFRVYTAKRQKTDATEENFGLTPQEIRIIELCRDKLKAKQIADKLCISARTVDTHKTNIFRKLELNGTSEMVQYAIKKGIITI